MFGMKHFIFTSLFLLSLNASGEYRAYQYQVSSKSYFHHQRGRIIVSTLDPQSYLAYHGGLAGPLKVQLLRTWMCFGHTGQKKICDSPLKTFAESLNVVTSAPSQEVPLGE
jgi:hypothetical protein